MVNLDSCKKWAPKHKWLKSNGELGIGTLKLCSATLRENILLNFEFKNESTRANLQENKRILKWWPFWNKVYRDIFFSNISEGTAFLLQGVTENDSRFERYKFKI